MPSISERLMLSCRRISLHDYEAMVSIGAFESERLTPQPVIFNVDVWTETAAERGKSLADVYDYTAVRSAIETAAGDGHIDLQETLVDRIAGLILADNRVLAVRVATQKPSCGFGVEIFKLRGTNA